MHNFCRRKDTFLKWFICGCRVLIPTFEMVSAAPPLRQPQPRYTGLGGKLIVGDVEVRQAQLEAHKSGIYFNASSGGATFQVQKILKPALVPLEIQKRHPRPVDLLLKRVLVHYPLTAGDTQVFFAIKNCKRSRQKVWYPHCSKFLLFVQAMGLGYIPRNVTGPLGKALRRRLGEDIDYGSPQEPWLQSLHPFSEVSNSSLQFWHLAVSVLLLLDT